jgi:hypothetical protein
MWVKGINALEIVFAMFILIVVTLVIIRLFTTTVTKETLPNIQDFRETYNYDKEKTKCDNLCSYYTSDGCSDLGAAVTYCQEKIGIDIDGNYRTNEKGHGGLITGVPYCEDGLYCFHITECGCGSYILSPKNCLEIMKEYYMNKMGLSENVTNQIIANRITPGKCNRDPNQWGKKFYEGYTPIKVPDNECKDYNLAPPCYLPSDWWWYEAGYAAIAAQAAQTASIAPPFLFICSTSGSFINCRWFGCPAQGEVVVFLSDGSLYKDVNKPIGSFSFGPLKPGSYSAVLICGENTASSSQIFVS